MYRHQKICFACFFNEKQPFGMRGNKIIDNFLPSQHIYGHGHVWEVAHKFYTY